jgi:hypothetical protein
MSFRKDMHGRGSRPCPTPSCRIIHCTGTPRPSSRKGVDRPGRPLPDFLRSCDSDKLSPGRSSVNVHVGDGWCKINELRNKSVNKPIEISLPEWKEIKEIEAVKEAWGLKDETPEEFASQVYGVKFRFQSGSPGYVGDLYIVQGDVLTGDPPWVFTRRNGVICLQQ